MLKAFDLWSHSDVQAHQDAILDRLSNGTMPCDGGMATGARRRLPALDRPRVGARASAAATAESHLQEPAIWLPTSGSSASAISRPGI